MSTGKGKCAAAAGRRQHALAVGGARPFWANRYKRERWVCSHRSKSREQGDRCTIL